MDICMYNPYDQCFHNCQGCNQMDKPEPDEDYLRDYERDEKYHD